VGWGGAQPPMALVNESADDAQRKKRPPHFARGKAQKGER
jgi:hypothetical protein